MRQQPILYRREDFDQYLFEEPAPASYWPLWVLGILGTACWVVAAWVWLR